MTKKKNTFMKDKKSQKLFEAMFKPYTKKEIHRDLKEKGILERWKKEKKERKREAKKLRGIKKK